MTTPTAAQVKKAHDKRKANGWHRLHLWLSPDAQQALARKQRPGESRTQAIERLLLE
jgi:hypothetical protein